MYIIRALRPDYLLFAATQFISDNMGSNFAETIVCCGDEVIVQFNYINTYTLTQENNHSKNHDCHSNDFVLLV